jgi:hypothetical protein
MESVSNVVRIPVIEGFFIETVDASPDPTFFVADPDLEWVRIRVHHSLYVSHYW